MANWITKYLPSGPAALLFTAVGFGLGQYLPAYIEYANEQRVEVASLIDQVSAKSDDLETTIRPLMLVAGDVVPASDEPRKSLDDKMLALFQTLEMVKSKLPASENERQAYVKAMRNLKDAASGLEGSLTGKRLVEAASAFKKARTDYEARLDALEPSFVGAVFTNIFS